MVRGDERERVGDGEERFSRRGLLMLWGSQRRSSRVPGGYTIFDFRYQMGGTHVCDTYGSAYAYGDGIQWGTGRNLAGRGGYTIETAVGLTIWEGGTCYFRAGSAFVRRRLDIMRRPT